MSGVTFILLLLFNLALSILVALGWYAGAGAFAGGMVILMVDAFCDAIKRGRL